MAYTLVSDNTFVQADNSPSASPGAIGNGWTDVTGNKYSYSSNSAYNNGAATLGSFNLMRLSESWTDGYINVYPQSSGYDQGAHIAIARYQDDNNFIYAYVQAVSHILNIDKKIAGTASHIGQSGDLVVPDNGQWYLQFRLTGTTLTASVLNLSDQILQTITVVDSSITAAGTWGVEGYTTSYIS